MKIIGHRGAMGYAPENTLKSIQTAIDMNVEMIEIDVMKSKDNHLVIIHDDLLDRTTNGTGFVKDFNYKELKKLDAGNGEFIPRIEEVIHLVNKAVKINLELKDQNIAKDISRAIDYCLRNGWKESDFIVSSFNHRELRTFKELMPNIDIALLYCGIPLNLSEDALSLKAKAINLSEEFVTQEIVEDAHKNNLEVNVYTVNDIRVYKKLEKLGIDGIFTNFPDRF